MSDIIAMEKSSLIAAIKAEVAPLKEHIAALEARLADARLRIDRDEDRLAQLEAALRSALVTMKRLSDEAEVTGYMDTDGWTQFDGMAADLRAVLGSSTAETPAEPITVLRECWNCGHDHDADQDIKFCHSCGAANPNSVGPQSNRGAKP